jgi:hypothetical protein
MRPVHKADNLTTIWEPTVCKMWDPQHPTTLYASTACYGDSNTLLYFDRNYNGLSLSHKYRQSRETGKIKINSEYISERCKSS